MSKNKKPKSAAELVAKLERKARKQAKKAKKRDAERLTRPMFSELDFMEPASDTAWEKHRVDLRNLQMEAVAIIWRMLDNPSRIYSRRGLWVELPNLGSIERVDAVVNDMLRRRILTSEDPLEERGDYRMVLINPEAEIKDLIRAHLTSTLSEFKKIDPEDAEHSVTYYRFVLNNLSPSARTVLSVLNASDRPMHPLALAEQLLEQVSYERIKETIAPLVSCGLLGSLLGDMGQERYLVKVSLRGLVSESLYNIFIGSTSDFVFEDTPALPKLDTTAPAAPKTVQPIGRGYPEDKYRHDTTLSQAFDEGFDAGYTLALHQMEPKPSFAGLATEG